MNDKTNTMKYEYQKKTRKSKMSKFYIYEGKKSKFERFFNNKIWQPYKMVHSSAWKRKEYRNNLRVFLMFAVGGMLTMLFSITIYVIQALFLTWLLIKVNAFPTAQPIDIFYLCLFVIITFGSKGTIYLRGKKE